jgi:hypothetical protein
VTVTGWASWPASVAQIWRKWASSRTAWRRSSSDTHDGKRDGTTTLFAALERITLHCHLFTWTKDADELSGKIRPSKN